MAEANDTTAMITQTLEDAGCDETTIACCLNAYLKGSSTRMLPILSRHRMILLDHVRSGQKQIDCIDYLIYKIQKHLI